MIEIGKIVEGALKRDIVRVTAHTEQLINKLNEDGETVAANKFRRLIEPSQSGDHSFAVY